MARDASVDVDREVAALSDLPREAMVELLATNRSQRDFLFDSMGTAGNGNPQLPEMSAVATQSIDETTITLLKRADLLANEWLPLSKERRRNLLIAMVRQVELHPSKMRLTISQRGLRQALSGNTSSDAKTLEQKEGDEARSKTGRSIDIVTLERPVILKKRGLEMRLVVGNRSTSQPDQALIDLIARAHAYLHDLKTIPDISLKQIACRHTVPPSEVSRHLPLAFLSPELTEAILKGGQSTGWSAQKFGRIYVPKNWNAQSNI